MTDDHDPSAKLRLIAEILGIPVGYFFTGAHIPDDRRIVEECVRLLYTIKTSQGRALALERILQVLLEEQT